MPQNPHRDDQVPQHWAYQLILITDQIKAIQFGASVPANVEDGFLSFFITQGSVAGHHPINIAHPYEIGRQKIGQTIGEWPMDVVTWKAKIAKGKKKTTEPIFWLIFWGNFLVS